MSATSGAGDADREQQALRLRTARMEAFSDGVFAIAITLLVLEIAVAPHSEDHLLRAILHEWPSYLAYAISFLTIGVTWLEHSAMTEFLEYADSLVLRLNLLLLMAVSFLPFPTKLVAESMLHLDAERVAVTFYGVTLLTVALIVTALWRYSLRAGLLRAEMADDEVRALTEKLSPSLLFYVVAIVLGLFLPRVAVFLYLGIAAFLVIPFRPIARALRRRRRPAAA